MKAELVRFCVANVDPPILIKDVPARAGEGPEPEIIEMLAYRYNELLARPAKPKAATKR